MAHTAPDFSPAEWDEVQKNVHCLCGLESDNYIRNCFAFKCPKCPYRIYGINFFTAAVIEPLSVWAILIDSAVHHFNR